MVDLSHHYSLSQRQTITAEKASLRLNPSNESLTIQLVDWKLDNGDLHYDGGKGSCEELELPLIKAAQRPSTASSASLVALRDIGSQSKKIREELGQHGVGTSYKKLDGFANRSIQHDSR